MTLPVVTIAAAALFLSALPAETLPAYISPADPPYNVHFNGTTDDTLGWTQAFADASSMGLPLIAGCGVVGSKVLGTIPIAAAVVASSAGSMTAIYNAGLPGVATGCITIYAAGTPGADGLSHLFDVTTQSRIDISHFAINCLSAAGEVAFQIINTGGSPNVGSEVSHNQFNNCVQSIKPLDAYYFTANDNRIWNFGGTAFAAIESGEIECPDCGDFHFAGNIIVGYPGYQNTYAYLSHNGGLYVLGGKIQGWDYGILQQMSAGVGTSDFIIDGVSMEQFLNSPIAFQAPHGGTFAHVVIIGNQMANCHNGYTFMNLTPGGWLSYGGITDNAMLSNGCAGISLNGATNFVTSPNF